MAFRWHAWFVPLAVALAAAEIALILAGFRTGLPHLAVWAPAVPGPALAADIQGFVKARLSAHEYPRAIEFRDGLPTTVTGKIRKIDLREEAPQYMK